MKKTILIVEDYESISNLIRINLKMAGYESNQVFDGIEAYDMITKEKGILTLSFWILCCQGWIDLN